MPHIEISSRLVEEGEPVYSVGYPLPETKMGALSDSPPDAIAHFSQLSQPPVEFATTLMSQRVTSAILAAQRSDFGMYERGAYKGIKYVIDKALNYGNSGGPIVAAETGKVFALCSEFKPVIIPQMHLGPNPIPIVIPSLYGVVASLSHQPVVDKLKSHGIPISEE